MTTVEGSADLEALGWAASPSTAPGSRKTSMLSADNIILGVSTPCCLPPVQVLQNHVLGIVFKALHSFLQIRPPPSHTLPAFVYALSRTLLQGAHVSVWLLP